MSNKNYGLHIDFYAEDGHDDYDYTACYSGIRYSDITDASFYGSHGDSLPN